MRKIILLTVLILLISLAYSFAEVPCKINYQGRLIKDNVPVDGTKKMVFSIYNDAVAVTPPLWTSGEVDVTVYNGLFRYVLDLSDIDDWTAGQELYLEVQVGADILKPREAIYAYPYAINSHLLEGATKEYFINTSGDTQTKQGNLNIMGNVGIGTTGPASKLDVSGAIKYSGSYTGTILYGNTNSTGTPTGDGFRVRYNAEFFGTNQDALVIEKTDGNQDSPDGGIAFVNTGQDGIEDTAMVIRGNGNVGIGTSPGAKLHVGGTAGTDGIMFPDGTLQTTAAAAVKVGQGSVGNGNNFNVQCGMSGTVLFCLKFDFIARYGDFGVMTARLRSQGGSSTLKARTGRTMEYDSRYSSAHVQIFYISTGNNPGETLTFNAYTPDGSHLINNPDYWYIGL